MQMQWDSHVKAVEGFATLFNDPLALLYTRLCAVFYINAVNMLIDSFNESYKYS